MMAIFKIKSLIQKRIIKTYVVQVEGEITRGNSDLETGVKLKDGITKPACIKKIQEPDWLWDRTPPIRIRKLYQPPGLKSRLLKEEIVRVERMTANVGFPT